MCSLFAFTGLKAQDVITEEFYVDEIRESPIRFHDFSDLGPTRKISPICQLKERLRILLLWIWDLAVRFSSQETIETEWVSLPDSDMTTENYT